MFKAAFKQYKAKSTSLDLSEVVNFEDPADVRVQCLAGNGENFEFPGLPGLKSPRAWQAFGLHKHPGLLVIPNPFTERGQRYWKVRCLRDYPKEPNIVNLNERLFEENVRSNWWRALQECKDPKERQRLKVSLRWTTLGYHHNWDSKVYSEQAKSPFPEDLSQLCQLFASYLGYKDFKSEAAIVNYYPLGSSLSGHTDHSEPNHSAPLFSFSFGLPAIFLIGGKTLEEKPTAIYLQSGDVLVMSGESRLCYHAVPRIIQGGSTPTSGSLSSEPMNGESIIDQELFNQVGDSNFWQSYANYMTESRININVRQVLKPGITQLTSVVCS
ncbi:hypothetical protein KR018_000723 [Drosophila ironensis]|nr:hypothetical protein KR018_000723 [Drosophila ironensis]